MVIIKESYDYLLRVHCKAFISLITQAKDILDNNSYHYYRFVI